MVESAISNDLDMAIPKKHFDCLCINELLRNVNWNFTAVYYEIVQMFA